MVFLIFCKYLRFWRWPEEFRRFVRVLKEVILCYIMLYYVILCYITSLNILNILKLYAFHISYISTIHLSVRFSLAASMLGPVCELLCADAFGVAPEWDKPHTRHHGNFLHLSLLRPPRPRESLVTGYRLPDSLGQTSGGPAFTKRPFNIFDNLRLWLSCQWCCSS